MRPCRWRYGAALVFPHGDQGGVVRRLEWLDEAKRPSRRRLAALDERGVDKAGQVNAQLAHCMLAVNAFRDVDAMGAWNICRWNLTKNGFLQPPYRENDKASNVRATQKGVRRAVQHAWERRPLGGGIPGSPPSKYAKFRKLFKVIEREV